MTKDDKERVIGKVVAINSDRFTIELLSGIENFNINGYDDINYFAQLNSYVIIPYQNFYIIAEVSGVRERDMNVPFTNPKEQILSKVMSGKFLEVLPIGALKLKNGSNIDYEFEFGVSVYPPLYTDTLYIKQEELDTIFNVKAKEDIVHREDCQNVCDCSDRLYKTLSIGKSSIFSDYDIKIDIDKFFGSHSAVLGNTGSGKSCTIASMIQGLYRLDAHSATGSTFVIFDVNGEYEKAFEQIGQINQNLKATFLTLNNVKSPFKRFTLPHWYLTIDEWALLLQASEKAQLPILRNALGLAPIFAMSGNLNKLKNHILAICFTQILRSGESVGAVSSRITSILQKFGTDEINLDTSFEVIDEATGAIRNSFLQGTNGIKALTIRNVLYVHFGALYGTAELLSYLNSVDGEGNSLFMSKGFKMPVYEPYQKFNFEDFEEVVDLAILYEEAHGNNQIRDYNASMITRIKSLKDRPDFKFFTQNHGDIKKYKRRLLGLYKKGKVVSKTRQIINIDLSSVEDEIVEVISCVVTRILYEAVKEITPRNSFPVNLVLEEAHRYIGGNKQNNFLKANMIFERVAKEGRKFGLFLMVSSQRPSELSKTVLSQCSNFIVHRIQNPEDLSHIRQITPHVSETVLKRMPSIPTQHALIFGHSVNLPSTFKVNNAFPLPNSDNNRISENWFKQARHVVNFK